MRMQPTFLVAENAIAGADVRDPVARVTPGVAVWLEQAAIYVGLCLLWVALHAMKWAGRAL